MTLARGDLVLTVAPPLGGAIASFSACGRPVLRQPHPAPVHADQLGCFPLVPFSNRVRDGHFAYGGRTITLPRNHFDPHPLHGDGWTAPWQVVRQSSDEALLEYVHHGTMSWPWRYRAEQHFRLAADRLAVDLSLTNQDESAFPAGLGLHPYFPRAGARLVTALGGVWLSDDTRLPTECVALPSEWDFSRSRIIDGMALDHCFVGWSGAAVIEWPYGRCELSASPPLDKLVIYVPPDGDFFCVEPVSNVIDGFNLRARGVLGTGVVDLAPGASLAVQMRLAIDGVW